MKSTIKFASVFKSWWLLLQGKELKRFKISFKNGNLNTAIVGQPAYKIAEMAGITVPKTTKILIGEVKSIDESEPFAHENFHHY